MPLFLCSKCGCYDNTAVTNYWVRTIRKIKNGDHEESPPLCSACDPEINEWHGKFEKKSAEGMVIGSDGFLYGKDQVNSLPVHITIIGEV
jgi:hypothetical protein